MPLSDEQATALTQLTEADAKDLIDALHEARPDVYDLAFNAGHKKATGEKSKLVRATEAKLEAAQGEIATLGQTIAELEEKAPDAKRLRDQYAERETQLKTQHETALQAARDTVTSERKQRAVDQLRAKLAATLLPDAVDAVLAKVQADGRIRVNDEGDVEVLQEGSDIPIAAPAGRDALTILADERLEKAPPIWKRSHVDGGGGTRGAAGGAGYDPVAAGKAMAAEEKNSKHADLAFK